MAGAAGRRGVLRGGAGGLAAGAAGGLALPPGGLARPGPALAAKVVSGFNKDATPGGAACVTAFHETPDKKQWYNEVFTPARDRIAAGEFGPALGATFEYLTLFEEGGDGVMVVSVCPAASAKALTDFYSAKNPLWKEGRKEGWLTGDFGYFANDVQGFRGPSPPPNMKGKGVGVYVFECALPFGEWLPQFTSADSDKLHAAAGITNSAVGIASAASGVPSPAKGKGFTGAVWHFHKTGKQAKAFCDKFSAHDEEPFKSIVGPVLKEGFFAKPYTVYADKEYPDKIPTA